ncbi:helix-turn-helix domain-containing protein [Amycolatopsis sp.]|uniref:PucR family transcriptional regulator n=1 Tax=Amycolatopsis sp. TaxID=37632 RepID=UPI002D808A59|nr:helix-turn-helix domain-containing protein [Amycolatopsis sp.]HET6704588.1 helix-turn-helix domain-containing protein [Amycolatopsis sp.]
MTVLDDRPDGRMQPQDGFVVDGIAVPSDNLLDGVTPPAARSVATALLDDVAAIYRRVVEEDATVTPAQRARVRIAGEAFAEAGGAPGTAADLLGRFAAQVTDVVARHRPHRVVSVVQVAHLLVQDLLAGAGRPAPAAPAREARCALVQRLLRQEQLTPAQLAGLEDAYVVVAARFPRAVPHDRLAAVLDEHHEDGLLGAPGGDGVVVLVPDRLERRISPLLEALAGRFDQLPWTTTVPVTRAALAAGCKEAVDVLALAAATGRPAGAYSLDDVLLEYAVLRDPVTSARLRGLISPLAGNEVLFGTLEALIRADFNRTVAARELFIHRSTLDYRIRRIEEVTGQNPLTGRGAYVLSAAVVVHAVSG